MGDRANIVLKGGYSFPHPVYLYTHWSGSEILERLKSALVKGQPRWDDSSYLARVIFQALLNGDEEITGYGLSTAMGDGDSNVLEVDMGSQTIAHKHGGNQNTWGSFAEFVGADHEAQD